MRNIFIVSFTHELLNGVIMFVPGGSAGKLFNVFSVAALTILKEAGPSIFFQRHSLIVPSGSLEAEPSNEMLSVGKVITWSGPATAIGDLLFSLQPSQDLSFLQEIKIPSAMMDSINKGRSIFFINEGFNGKAYLVVIITIPTNPLPLYHHNTFCRSII